MSRGRALGPGRLVKRNGTWHLDWTDASGRRERRALSTNRATAEQIRVDLLKRRDLERAGLGSLAGQDKPLADLAREYLVDLEPRVSPRHFRQVRSRLEASLTGLGVERVSELRPMHATALRNARLAAGASPRTANLVVTTLAAMLRWAVQNELIAQNPLQNVRKLPEGEGHRRYRRRALTEEEIERFLTAARADDEQCELLWSYARVPQLPLWCTLLEVGARYGELVRVSWGDVDLARGTLRFRAETTKAKRERVLPLRLGLVQRLTRLKVLHETVLHRIPAGGSPVFLTPEGRPWPWHTANLMRIFDRVLRSAGIPKLDAEGRKLDLHALRTTAGSRMARNGVPLASTQRILGHSTPALTARHYVDLSVEDLRGAVEGLPELGQVAKRKAKEAT